MVVTRAPLMSVFLLGYALAHSGASNNCAGLLADATVEIQYDGQVGSGVIQMTRHPESCTGTTYPVTTPIASTAVVVDNSKTISTMTPVDSGISYNTPPAVGTSPTKVLNATTSRPPQIVSGTQATQVSSDVRASTLNPSPITGSGSRANVAWSHVFLWTAIAEIIIDCI